MFSEATTLHFHGIHQFNNLWMDGVPYVTQCPIQPGLNFTYRFIAEPAGTHWYHSHVSDQRMDGLFGMLVVHKDEPEMPYYDMSVMDWGHTPAESVRSDNPFQTGDYQSNAQGSGKHCLNFANRRFNFDNSIESMYPFESVLINGRGRQMHSTEQWPLEVFEVEGRSGRNNWRFHVAHTGTETALRVSVDQHMLTIVATDDGSIEPIEVQSFYINAGETVDFEIRTNQSPARYWMRFETIGIKTGVTGQIDSIVNEGRAILKYDTVRDEEEPTTSPIGCTQAKPCHVFNCPFERFPAAENRICISIDEARTTYSQEEMTELYGLNSLPDRELILNFNFANRASINGHEFVYPKQPLFSTADYRRVMCDAEHCENGCKCTHTINLAENQIVQLVLTNYDDDHKSSLAAHPVHLHGNSVAVMKVGYGPLDPVTGAPIGNNPDINCTTPNCSWTRWTNEPATLNMDRPVVKNTVTIPPQGYVVVRMHTDNLGYWMLHCHSQRHTRSMAMLLYVNSLPTVPENFPYCDNFDFGTSDGFEKYLDHQKRRQLQAEGKRRR